MTKRDVLNTVFMTMRMRKEMMQARLSELINAHGSAQSANMRRANLKLVLLLALDDLRQLPPDTFTSMGETSLAIQTELCNSFNREFPNAESCKDQDANYLVQACQVLAIPQPPGINQGFLDPTTMPKSTPELN
jgi:hypothetical protein